VVLGEVLKEEGFVALPRRLDEERPEGPRPTIEPVADVREFSLVPRTFSTPRRRTVSVRPRSGPPRPQSPPASTPEERLPTQVQSMIAEYERA